MGPTQTTSAKEATLVTDASRDAIFDFLIHSRERETRDLLLLNATLSETIERLGFSSFVATRKTSRSHVTRSCRPV